MPFSVKDIAFMNRCLQLASLGKSEVRENPMVGALIVHDDRIIGEGYHEKSGDAHAEINALQSVSTSDRDLVRESTLYVSLEPCNHYGKTPPCVDAILKAEIPKVVIAHLDPNPQMMGKSMDVLRSKGVEAYHGLLEKEARWLNRRFIINKKLQRPFIILKYAESSDFFMGHKGHNVQISGEESRILVHKWRSEVDAIMVGTQTVITDNPLLSCRHYPGESPVRVIPDRYERIPKNSRIFTDQLPTWIYTVSKSYQVPDINNTITVLDGEDAFLESIIDHLYAKKINCLFIEGGPRLLKAFIDLDLWDEARVLRSSNPMGDGISSPLFKGKIIDSTRIGNDKLLTINHLNLENSLMG